MNFTNIEAFVFDLDGVVWLGATPIPGVAEAISLLRSSDKQIRFFTNNAALHRRDYVKKLAEMDIPASVDEVLSSGYAATAYITKRFSSAKVHVMGAEGLKTELLEAGHSLVERGADVVLVGYDREFNWEKLDQAFQNVFEDKALFVACNLDKRYVEKGAFRPGTGATVAALSCCLEKEPDVVAGKPNQPMIDALFDGLALEPSQCVIVGDKLYTDIACGRKAGMHTILVRSGQGQEEEQKITPETAPELIIDSVADIGQLL